MAVHPHACGENIDRHLQLGGNDRFTPTRVGKTSRSYGPLAHRRGSPPRVWGKLVNLSNYSRVWRFTPTRVGKTVFGGNTPASIAVHPHACGENALGLIDTDGADGSPPRVWGKLWLPFFRAFSRPVHPHACGENVLTLALRVAGLGSPPRVWGKLVLTVGPPRRVRFTPTRVGKTVIWVTSSTNSTVHPHACGENDQVARQLTDQVRFTPTRVGKTARDSVLFDVLCGSPPRVWGKLAQAVRRMGFVWFTPTRVGKTRLPQIPTAGKPVHPHACGENVQYLVVPRLTRRFTPTRVGKTRRPVVREHTRTVHPHACGENSTSEDKTDFNGGSPPRVWGKRMLSPPVQHYRGSPPRVWGKHRNIVTAGVGDRFTPTRVGKTKLSFFLYNNITGSPPRVWGKHARSNI